MAHRKRWLEILAVSILLLPILPVGSALVAPADSAGRFQVWWNASGSPAPPSAAGTMMAYDGAADRFVFFGGWDGSVPINETWQLDAAHRTWTQMHPPLAPRARADAALVFDPQNALFYLFGGWAQLPNGTIYRLNDTWSYSLTLDVWIQLPNGGAPSPRSDAAVAFDASENLLVLFGGFSGSAYLGGTWAFSPDRSSWSELAVGGTFPGNRSDGRMTYDPAERLGYLFGGNDYNGPNFTFHHLNDTWSFDAATLRWSKIATARAPPARDYAIQGVAPLSDWLLVFSGYGNRTSLNDLWAFAPANSTWWPIDAAGAPPARYAGTGGFDDAAEQFVVVGGASARGVLNDTWILNATGSASPSAPPPSYDLLLIGLGVAIAGVATAVVLALASRRRAN